nr:hypothetical protein LTR18_001301 [Exophiala xenobiotica]
MTFAELRHEKPLLVLAIMMVSCRHDQMRQTAIAKKLRELISHKMLIQGERNLDILQCLLVDLSWYQLHVHLGSQVGNLLHLIMAMATDLGLNRGVVPPIPAALAMRNPKIAVPTLSATRTLEERRTFLGCFFLTSMYVVWAGVLRATHTLQNWADTHYLLSRASMCVRDIYPIQHSRYVEECCQAISAAAEYPTDNYVVHLTRLHGMADSISRSLSQDVRHGIPASGPAPLGACVKLLESELQQLRSSLVEGERQNAILLLHFYAIEIFLYQTALNGDVEPALYGMYPFSRLHILYACLNSTKLCFETAYTLPPSQWFDLPWSVWSLLGHAIVVLSRLSLLQAEGWDQEYVRRTINFSGTMDALAQQLDIARVLAESQSFQIGHNQLPRVVPQVFLTYSAKLRRVKASHEAKYMAQSMNSHPMPDLPPMDALDIPTDDDFAMPYTTFFCDFLDESFWQQFT